MQLQLKKTIAKEILILFSCPLISLLIFFLVIPYNRYYTSKLESTQTSLILKTKELDSLILDNKKPLSFVTKPYLERTQLDSNLILMIKDGASKEDAISYTTDYIKKYGRIPEYDEYGIPKVISNDNNQNDPLNILNKRSRSESEVTKEINTTCIFIDSLIQSNTNLNKRIVEIKNDIQHLKLSLSKYNQSIITASDKKYLVFNSLLAILIIVYPMRLIYYLIKWSINTLKHN
jgi:hypothetical protein